MLCNLLGKDNKPNFGPDRAGDIKHSNADIKKATKELGYNVSFDFSSGLYQYIEESILNNDRR